LSCFYILYPETCCSVCGLPVVGSCQCTCCSKYVHAEECSMRNPNGSDDRICTNCFCLLCKSTIETSNHVCQCHICDLPAPTSEGVICYRCEKITHPGICANSIRAKEKLNELRFICKHCLYSLSKLLYVSPFLLSPCLTLDNFII